MKRNKIATCLWLAIVALAAVFGRADVCPRPSRVSYHALSRSAWEREIANQERKQEQVKVQQEQRKRLQERWQRWQVWLGKTGVGKLHGIYRNLPSVLQLSSPLIFGILASVYLYWSIRLRRRRYFVGMALTFLLLILSCTFLYVEILSMSISVAYYDDSNSVREQKNNENSIREDYEINEDVTVDPELGESYEEYLKRVHGLGAHREWFIRPINDMGENNK